MTFPSCHNCTTSTFNQANLRYSVSVRTEKIQTSGVSERPVSAAVLPVSMAEPWRVVKQSRRSSLSRRCRQLSPSTSITPAHGEGGCGTGSVRRPAHRRTESAGSRVAPLSITNSLWFSFGSNLLLGPVPSCVLPSPWQHPTNQQSSQRGRAAV